MNRTTTCPRCGSSRLISDALVENYGASTPTRVYVDADPKALMLKERVAGTLRAEVCGGCGHVCSLRVENHDALWLAYQRSRGR